MALPILETRVKKSAPGRHRAHAIRSLQTVCSSGSGDVTVLGRDIIHSVTNPLDKLSYALHVYDGDFLARSPISLLSEIWNYLSTANY
jgi:hypothetical protein